MLATRVKLIISIFFSIIIITLTYIASPLKPLIPHLDYLLGTEKPTTYLILLQNNTEMRANGGFAGSYAKLTLNFPKVTLDFQDIYVPNGQLQGHVSPPPPIQQAFKHGTWELANADWEPDFPTAAKAIRWFFTKGDETNPDILLTLNLDTIKKILKIVGPFKVWEYEAVISPENVYSFLQSQAETDFFPGSTQKKDALTAVGNSLKKKLFQLNIIQYFQISQIILDDLNHSNLLLHSEDQNFQSFIEKAGWSGKIIPGGLDTFMTVETNLGANKANCCIERETTHIITKENSTFKHKTNIKITNTSSGHNPNPPFDFSGHYISYIRLYIPKDSWDIQIIPLQSSPSGVLHLPPVEVVTTPNKFGLTEIGFFHTTASSTTSNIDLSYKLSTGSATFPYSLKIIKQNGLHSSPLSIIYDGQTATFSLSKTAFFP